MGRIRMPWILPAVLGMSMGVYVFSLPAPERSEEGAVDLQNLLQRISESAERFHREFSTCVLEEKYVQKSQSVSGNLHPIQKIRSLRSDVLLVWLQESGQWALFRDVYEVDGQPVRGREERLQKLFLESPASLETITTESARYNLGPVRRNINVPTLVLSFLRKENISRFHFKIAGKDKVERQIVCRVDFSEQSRQTMISNRGQDTVCQGSIWTDPETGTILRTRLVVSGSGSEEPKADIQVTFKQSAPDGIALPAFMTEFYNFPHSSSGVLAPQVSGRADYTNIRRFKIQTEESVTPQSAGKK